MKRKIYRSERISLFLNRIDENVITRGCYFITTNRFYFTTINSLYRMIPKTIPEKIIADFSIALSRFPLVFVNVPVLMNYERDCILICTLH